MKLRSVLTALVAFAATSPVAALEVIETVLQVSFTHDGREYVYDDGIVPLLPGNACYNWYVRVDQTGQPVTMVERMMLPQAIDWGTTGTQPDDPTQIEADGKVAVTTLPITTDGEGWLAHGWCVADGDPLGPHSIEVSVGGEPLASFAFEVVSPEDYPFPDTYVPERSDRSTHNSW